MNPCRHCQQDAEWRCWPVRIIQSRRPIENPQASTRQIIVKLVQNAFVLPGIERQAKLA
jgi:hypothetical protein